MLLYIVRKEVAISEDTLKGIDDFNLFSLDISFHVENEKLTQALINLTVREKFVSDKTYRQIGEVLHISRQGVDHEKLKSIIYTSKKWK